jgi:hypothetical protein
MERQSSIWFTIWKRLVIWSYVSSLIPTRVWVLPWYSLLRTVEQGICTSGPQYFQVTKWLNHYICRMSYFMGFQISIPSSTLHYWGWVHCNVTSFTWHHSCHGAVIRNEGARFQGSLYWALCELQSLWRHLRLPQISKASNFCPRTKHINVCYHYFCKHVQKGLIKIFSIDTKEQIAYALTKPMSQNDFQHHRRFMCGKWPP